MIEQLTPEQVALQAVVREEWIRVGLCTEPADFAAGEAAIKVLYEAARQDFPERIEHVPSPLAGERLAQSLGIPRFSCDWGQHDVAWLARWDYFRRIGVRYAAVEDALLDTFMQIVRSIGWWWPMDRALILSDRPEIVHMAPQGTRLVLHCLTGPAIRYRDGFGVYAVRGVRVPAEVIESPETITAAQVLAERNVEIARIMLDQMGERFWAEARAEVLDEDIDGGGQPRRLLSIDMPHDPDRRVVVVEVTCPSTGHRYILRVPPAIRTCLTGVAWTYGMAGEEYLPLVES